jgi:uncharacterized membrane protein YfcA
LFNSVSELAGYFKAVEEWSAPIPTYVFLLSIAGAIIGERINNAGHNAIITKLLAIVLVAASAKIFYYNYV